MELRLKPTEQFFMADDVMVRMWQGTATHDDGTEEPAIALITAVAFTGQAEIVAEGLVSIPPPTPQDAERWARRVLEGP
jgi:hypothetical protein